MKNGGKVKYVLCELDRQWSGGYVYVKKEDLQKFKYYTKDKYLNQGKYVEIGEFEFDMSYIRERCNEVKVDDDLIYYDATWHV